MFIPKKLIYWLCEIAAFIATCWLFLVCLYPLMVLIFMRRLFMKKNDTELKDNQEITVGIFHPYCNAGAGGERVLWSVVKALQSNYKNVHVFIYTGDLEHDRETILSNVEKVFDIKMQDNINIVYLHRRKWIEAKMYPFCTLLGQSLGSVWVGWEALTLFKPDIFIDTMGYAFTYPLFKYLGNCKVASYTHYPIISTDMLNCVSERITAVNNRHVIARNPLFTVLKLGYYKGIAFLYGLTGRTADIVMVNSSWTKDHINFIWNCPKRTHLLYPPCDVDKLTQLPLLNEEQKNHEIHIISVSQFRPEKNHKMMIEVMYKIKSIVDADTWKKIRLVLIGSCRNEDDKSYVQKLKSLTKKLHIEDNVDFRVNISYSHLIYEMQKGTIGIHAMWNEHFGISVVDALAAGLIMVANASGGPKADIIDVKDKTRTGYLANGVTEYAETIVSIINMSTEERKAISNAARKSVNRFSTKCFEQELVRIVMPFFKVKES
ncbi:GDP-Man:Man(3)GlcNAc(2)-PP-Dol alpha-1,2-mannosyltransferase-like [Phymastichus coffea]|uniref:GDP-Man:Man(3)GlcNAc(2)-PP-Dol alpha-1,2-mannosyltransferase-like n=1 Tax=Phymastichus coffea TaxID=108790 RepID=UPI00273A8DC3|nr:GDP-Man:Man(3)GlcNAc(2)-PP-Dol alpha-1,2-mannosyltransferase-like [Phymastichus coffea]